jgi:hypothetical protein
MEIIVGREAVAGRLLDAMSERIMTEGRDWRQMPSWKPVDGC